MSAQATPRPILAGLALLVTVSSPWSLAACGGAASAGAGTDPAAGSEVVAKRTVALPTGVTLAYVELGSTGGEPVILLHGITDTSTSFLDTARHLAELRPDLRLLAVDLRGHGDSSMPDPALCRSAPQECFRVADFAADTIAFLDRLGVARAYLVGHSLGTLIAQELALEHPERVRRIALIATTASVVGNPAIQDFLVTSLVEGTWRPALEAKGVRWPEAAYELRPVDADPEVADWLLANWVTEPTADPRLLRRIAPETAQVAIGTWLGAGRAVLEFDTRQRLRGLTVPALVLWPVQDPMFLEQPHQRELLDALHAATRDCGLHFTWKQYGRAPLPASGVPDGDISHNLHWGPAREVARDLATFLREGGEPTRDEVYADPADPKRLLVEPGAARMIEGRPRTGAPAGGAACRRAVPAPSAQTVPR